MHPPTYVKSKAKQNFEKDLHLLKSLNVVEDHLCEVTQMKRHKNMSALFPPDKKFCKHAKHPRPPSERRLVVSKRFILTICLHYI